MWSGFDEVGAGAELGDERVGVHGFFDLARLFVAGGEAREGLFVRVEAQAVAGHELVGGYGAEGGEDEAVEGDAGGAAARLGGWGDWDCCDC